jgi:hypothetical protein
MSDSGFGSYQSLSTLSATEPSTIPSRAESELSSPSPPLRHSSDPRLRCYSSSFSDLMEMWAPAELVASYLDHHEGWFRRCAAPMTVRPLGNNGYSLTLGRFGNFGFEVEPTIGLELLPQDRGVYRIVTAASDQPETPLERLYDVEFNASLKLQEQLNPAEENDGSALRTEVIWDLDLNVWIQLPGVISLLPEALVQTSGDHLLRQIVRRISRRLTWKVQEDFHASHGLNCPPRRRAQF